jgi:hypothetical protein
MKKTLLFLTFIIFSTIIARAQSQWTSSGTNIYNNNSGNVGIGTTNPSAILSVKGSALPTPQWSGYTSSMQVGELIIQDYNVIPQVGIMQNVYWDGSANKYILNGYASQMYMGANGAISFSVYNSGTSGSPVSGTGIAMTIANNGNVGIGTPSPDTKLAVNGTIHSRSVLIDLNGWSDYVFKKNYRLPSLSEVKTYIDQNQHLPEIPSEQEMVKKGLDVSEMNKLLMKKVEELTLYLIEKDKELKEQSQGNSAVQAKLKLQQQQIDQLSKKFDLLADKLR